MTSGQTTVVILLLVLFALEVARSATVKAWLTGAFGNVASVGTKTK